MYTKYYGLTKKPFENTPDPNFLFLSKNHREVLASLAYAINAAKGFVLVAGDIGTGKTTLIHALIKQLDPSFIILNIINPRATFKDIIQYLGKKIGATPEKANSLEIVEAIQNKLETLHESGRHAVLIVDEAHLLSDEALEDIRLISNIEDEERKLIQIILVGQNELSDKLQKESLRPLQQRLVVTRRLVPLNRKETQEYILHRLRVAGKQSQLFERKALLLIWKKSRGIPRLINQICDNAMLIGYAVEARSIGGKIIKEVIGDMESVHKVQRHGQAFLPHRLRWIGVVAVVALLAGYLGTSFIDGKHFFSKSWIFRKNSVPVQTEISIQPKNNLARQSGELLAKDSFPVEIGVSSKQVETDQLSNVAGKMPVDKPETSGNKQFVEKNESLETEKQATESRDSSAAGELQDSVGENNIIKLTQEPNNIEELPADTFRVLGEKRSTEENKPLGLEQQLTISMKKSVAGESQARTEEKNNGTNLLQKPANFDGLALSKTAYEKAGDTRKRDDSNRRKVRLNECLYDLARREYGIGNISIVGLIQMANPGIRDVNLIYPGQDIIFPHIGRKDLIVKDEKGIYHIHYASFYNHKDATLCIQNLINKNQEASIFSTRQGDNLVYRVYLGMFKNSNEAKKTLDTLELEYFYFLAK
jgi:type II secretory pathway predicted ATPase ExeA